MMNLTIRDIQKTDLEILLAFIEICKKHGLTYWLSSGTLLGAVRHKGFIPWDDDVDVEMPIEDYKRFCKIAQAELGARYFFQTYKTDKQYDMQFAKIRKNGTTSMPVNRKGWHIHWGICIDIFPVIGLYDSVFLRKLQWKLFKINAMLLSIDRNYYSSKNKSKKAKLAHLVPRFVRYGICNLNNIFLLKAFRKSDKGTMLWSGMGPWWTKEACAEDVFLEFEGHMLAAPKGYKTILENLYGDYMQLPPEAEREGHTLLLGNIIFDLEKDYREYQ